MGEWYENESRYEHTGWCFETGSHSIYEFEIYRDLKTNELVCCDHDDPDQPIPVSEVRVFFEERGEGERFNSELNQILETLARDAIHAILS